MTTRHAKSRKGKKGTAGTVSRSGEMISKEGRSQRNVANGSGSPPASLAHYFARFSSNSKLPDHHSSPFLVFFFCFLIGGGGVTTIHLPNNPGFIVPPLHHTHNTAPLERGHSSSGRTRTFHSHLQSTPLNSLQLRPSAAWPRGKQSPGHNTRLSWYRGEGPQNPDSS